LGDYKKEAFGLKVKSGIPGFGYFFAFVVIVAFVA